MATTGNLISKANFDTSWHNSTSGTNPGADGTWWYICAPAFRFQMETEAPSSIFQSYAKVIVDIHMWNGSSWESVYYTEIARNGDKKHCYLSHNDGYTTSNSNIDLRTVNGQNHLFEVRCKRTQGEGEKCPWYLYAGGMGMVSNNNDFSYTNHCQGNPIYGIGSSNLYWKTSSESRSTALSTFATSLKRGSLITASLADFSTQKKIGE